MYSIDKSLSGTWTLFEDFKFEKLEKSVFKDVYFNTSKENLLSMLIVMSMFIIMIRNLQQLFH
ncbi:MAG: hypothetical protein V8R16_07155 [Bacilli bacterium]